MNERQLRIFLETERLGSISKAARELNYAPQSAKESLDILERELGCRLFERSQKGVVPTAAGHELKAGAAEVLQLMESVRARVYAAAHQVDPYLKGSLTAVVPFNVTFRALQRAINAFERAHPGVAIRYHQYDPCSMSMFDAVREGHGDIAVASEGTFSARRADGLAWSRCDQIALGNNCIVREGHPLCAQGGGQIAPEDLAGYPVAYAGFDDPDWTARVPHVQRLSYNVYEIDAFCRTNDGAVVCVDAFEVDADGLRRLPFSEGLSPSGFIHLKDPDPVVQALIAFCQRADDVGFESAAGA